MVKILSAAFPVWRQQHLFTHSTVLIVVTGLQTTAFWSPLMINIFWHSTEAIWYSTSTFLISVARKVLFSCPNAHNTLIHSKEVWSFDSSQASLAGFQAFPWFPAPACHSLSPLFFACSLAMNLPDRILCNNHQRTAKLQKLSWQISKGENVKSAKVYSRR